MITSSLPPAPSPLATILVVDDASDSLALLAGILTREGYQVQPVDSGELALAAVAANPPDLILLDVRMQGMDGFEVCRRLKAREETRHIPIILISAFAEPEEWVEGLELGAADYIAKPFRTRELLARVKTHLSLSRAEVSLEQHAATLQQSNVKLQSEIVERKRIQAELQQSFDRAERSRRALLSTLEDQKRTEEALRESETRFRAVFEGAGDGMFVLDLESRKFVISNAACSRMLGFTPEEFLNLGIPDLHLPEDLPFIFEEVEKFLKGEAEVRTDTRFKRRDGSTFFADLNPTLITMSGRKGVLVAFRDITERKQAGDALRQERDFADALLNSLPGIFYVNDGQRMLRCNQNAERVTGYTRAEIARMSPLDFHPEDDRELVRARIEEVFAKGASEVEAHLIAKDGTRTPYYLTGLATRIDDKLCLIGMGIDITERKRAEEALRASRQQLRDLSARLRDTREEEQMRIAREIHDDLGQALTGLKMDLRWIEHQTEKLGAGPQMGAILDKIVTAAGLVDETVATVQRIAAELRPGILDRLGLIATLRHEAGRFQERTGCAVRLDLPDEEPRMPPAVATAFFRICQETLTNVARHAGAGSVDIALRPENGGLLLEVRDDGKGITLGKLNSRHSLGLLGMRERAAALGGEAEFRRGPERGTIVSVRIPTTAAEVERA